MLLLGILLYWTVNSSAQLQLLGILYNKGIKDGVKITSSSRGYRNLQISLIDYADELKKDKTISDAIP